MALKVLVLLTVAVLPVVFAVLPVDYVGLTGAAKRDVLWSRVNESPHAGKLPNSNPGPLSMANMFNPVFLVKTFNTESDEWDDPNHVKLIHTYGSVAKVRLNINESSTYSGVFKAGSSTPALIRLSVAKQDADHFLPGLALKLLIDGKSSQNIIAMFSLDGQGKDKNFFSNTFWNIINDPTGFAEKLLAKAFRLALQLLPGGAESRPLAETNLPLVEHASVDNQGNVPRFVRAPWKISFIPNPAVGWSSTSSEDFRVKLGAIPTGSVLYTIVLHKPDYADFDPANHNQDRLSPGPTEAVGEVITEGPFVASKYGDKSLLFQHHRMPYRF